MAVVRQQTYQGTPCFLKTSLARIETLGAGYFVQNTNTNQGTDTDTSTGTGTIIRPHR